MTVVHIESGTLTANADERTIAGLLLKYGEIGRTNLGPVKVKPGAFKLPADVTKFLNLNLGHDGMKPLGPALFAQDTPEGIYGVWHVEDTPAGNALLAQYAAGDPEAPRKLSIEVDDVKVRNGEAYAGSVRGAGVVKAGAFPSSTLLAEEEPEPVEGEPAEKPEPVVEKFTEERTENGVTRKYTTTRTTVVDGDTTTITEKTVIEEPDQQEPTEEEPTVGVPNTLTAAKAGGNKPVTANDVFEMMTAAMKGEGSADSLLAALTDIKISGANQLPTGGNAVQPSWLGEVYAQKSYVRRYMPLIKQGSITAIEEKGFTVATGAEPVQPWAGNKAELPTMSGTTSPLASIFQRWAVANDIAREFYDIPAGRAVIEAYIRLLVNSYSRVTDYWTLQQLITAAGTPVEVDAFPAGYDAALAKVIQAIDLVDETEAEPTFVVVAADVWRDLRYTPKDKIPEYVTFSLNRTEGSADGGVVLLKDKAGKLAAGQVLGGGREAAHVNELPGASPMQLDALDIVHGGIDKAILGYTQYMTEFADALVIVGNDTP